MKNKITFEEHKKFGELCKRFNEKLIDNLHSYKTKREAESSHEKKAIELITSLKDHMEDILFKDYPERHETPQQDQELMNVYYGEGKKKGGKKNGG